MNSGRVDLLIPILNELTVNDQRIFPSIDQRIRRDPTEYSTAVGSSITFSHI